MLEEDYDIKKARLINLKPSCTSPEDDQAVPSAPASVRDYVLSEHLRNANHCTGTKWPRKPLGQKGLTFFEDLLYSRYVVRGFANVISV